jgi:hypothetical protein
VPPVANIVLLVEVVVPPVVVVVPLAMVVVPPVVVVPLAMVVVPPVANVVPLVEVVVPPVVVVVPLPEPPVLIEPPEVDLHHGGRLRNRASATPAVEASSFVALAGAALLSEEQLGSAVTHTPSRPRVLQRLSIWLVLMVFLHLWKWIA